METNDNHRMVPPSELPEAGTIRGDGEVILTRDLDFDRHCIANDVEPKAWRSAIASVQARWILSAG